MSPNEWEAITLEDTGPQQRGEFVKKYKGTYMWVTFDTGKKHLCLFEGFKSSTDTLIFTNETFGELSIMFENKHVISPAFPRIGAFTHEDQYMVFNRVPARQYRKAPCMDNCRIDSPIWEIPGYSFKLNQGISQELLESAYEHKCFTIDEAIKRLTQIESATGYALSKWFGLTIHPSSEDVFLLWRDAIPVAEVVGKDILVKVSELEQEIQDFIKRNHYSYRVINEQRN